MMTTISTTIRRNPRLRKNQAQEKTNIVVYDYPSADTYTPDAGNTKIDVDKYNRRGIFAKGDTLKQNADVTDFNSTRKIERFHNPDIIVSSDDADLASIYYSQPATSINIYVNNDPFAYNYWGFPSYSSWYWGYPRSWYAWNWNWSWNWGWNWGWGPSWSWGWGPAWSWTPGWGPGCGWGPSWSWGWTAPVRPNRPIGNIRPGYGSRPSGNYRPGSGNAYRPGSRPSYGINQNNGYRPGNSSSGYRSGYRQSIRPGAGNNRNQDNAYRNNQNYNNNNKNNTYRPSYNNSSRNTGSFSSGGGLRGGGSTGTVRGGGGGRGRH